MCLESKIVELTEAVRALTVAMSGGGAAPAKVEQPVAEKITPPVEEKKESTPHKKPAAAQVAPKEEVVNEGEAEGENQAAVPSYEEEVKPALVMLADALNDRNAFIAFLGRFGVNSAKNLLPAQYASVLEGAKAELAKVGAV